MSTREKKKYCENCKYYIDLFGSLFFPDGFMGEVDHCVNDKTPMWENPLLNRNFNNDCESYKRKWWKFWVA